MATLLFAVALLQTLNTPQSVPGRLWEVTLPERILTVAASDGRCIAALTPSTVVVYTPGGDRLWSTAFPEPADSSYGPGILALAPSCTWAAVAAGFTPMSVYIVRQDGSRTTVDVGRTYQDDLVARSEQLDERWRLPGAYLSAGMSTVPGILLLSTTFVQHDNRSLRAYEMTACR